MCCVNTGCIIEWKEHYNGGVARISTGYTDEWKGHCKGHYCINSGDIGESGYNIEMEVLHKCWLHRRVKRQYVGRGVTYI